MPAPLLTPPQDGRVEHRILGELPAVRDALKNETCSTFDTRFMQLLAYSACLHERGARHQWMGAARGCAFFVLRSAAAAARCRHTHPLRPLSSPLLTHSFLALSSSSAAYIDADEFFVLTDGTPDLPSLLRDYERYGGLGVNW